ncbi:hypothetical protein HK405_010053 [Cladochytrium tenue]|nr:hypothetical protein HK405_010053 [Cladochytrium tenue]
MPQEDLSDELHLAELNALNRALSSSKAKKNVEAVEEFLHPMCHACEFDKEATVHSIRLLSSCFKGDAVLWWDNQNKPATFDDFATLLRDQYYHVEDYEKTQVAMKNISQGSKTVLAYQAEFNLLALRLTDWSENSLCDSYYLGLRKTQHPLRPLV